MKNILITFLILAALPQFTLAQHSDETGDIRQFHIFEDSLASLGKKIVNNETDVERQNANYTFIRTLVSALKISNSFLFPFDSVKTISIVNSPDNRFRILSWFVVNDDGTYRFYGAIQMNTGGSLKLYPLEDYTGYITAPEDTITDSKKWYGAEYYRIIPVYSPKLYYVLLGWKGYSNKITKKVIDVLSFKDDKPVFGLPVFEGNGGGRKRVVFEYTRMASMLLRYVPDRNLIVFDHLAPPSLKLKNHFDTYGPDLSYDGYVLKNGYWVYMEDLDMRNAPDNHDGEYVDPRKQARADRDGIR